VLDTQLIAGGRPATFHLISRQVMQVTVPPNPQVLPQGDVDVVDFHLAAPYGVSTHLLIPVASKAAALGSSGGFAWGSDPCINFWYTAPTSETASATVDAYSETNLPQLAIAVPSTSGLAVATELRVHLFDEVDAATRVFVGTEQAQFAFDPRAGVLFLSGDEFTKLRTNIGKAIGAYLQTKCPKGAEKTFTAEGELAPANLPPIKVSSHITVNLKKKYQPGPCRVSP